MYVYCVQKNCKIYNYVATSSVSMYFYWEEILQFLHYSQIYSSLFWEAVDMKGNAFSYSFENPIGIRGRPQTTFTRRGR